MRPDVSPDDAPAPGPTTLVLSAVAVLSCALLAGATGTRLVFGDGSLQALALLLAVRLYVGWRMPELRRVALMLGMLCVTTLAASAMGFLSYFAPMAAFPLRDAELRALDLALGFDWLGAAHLADGLPWLNKVLKLAYATLPVQVIAVVLVLVATRQRDELDRFVITFVATALVVVLVSALLPALGPAPTLAHAGMFRTLELGAAWVSPDIVRSLREGGVNEIDLGKMAGIVTFPSFHTVVALIVPYALRRVPAAFWPALALNGLMLLSTFTEGGHYLVDVIAGAAVAVAGIAFAAYAKRRLDPPIHRLARQLIAASRPPKPTPVAEAANPS